MGQVLDVETLALIWRPQDVLHDGGLHGADIVLEDIMEKKLDLHWESAQQEVWHEI